MKDTFNGWDTLEGHNLDSVVNLILTGKKADEAVPDKWLHHFMGDTSKPLRVLDFGCGVGRNTFGLAKQFPHWKVVGYDNEAMIDRSKTFFEMHYDAPLSNFAFATDWDQIKTQKFDVIVCILVLQHVREEPLKTYAADFKNMTNYLVVSGRRFNDDVKNRSTWTILEENGFTPIEFYSGHNKIKYTPEGEPEDHNTAIYRW